MISKSSASFLILLSLLTVSLPFPAAQRAPHLPGRLPFSLPGQTGLGGMPHRAGCQGASHESRRPVASRTPRRFLCILLPARNRAQEITELWLTNGLCLR